jgi:hypothetical protein
MALVVVACYNSLMAERSATIQVVAESGSHQRVVLPFVVVCRRIGAAVRRDGLGAVCCLVGAAAFSGVLHVG